jgi:hypothetical protein
MYKGVVISPMRSMKDFKQALKNQKYFVQTAEILQIEIQKFNEKKQETYLKNEQLFL